MSDEEREYLNEMIRSLNNQLVDALRERDEARRKFCQMMSDNSRLEFTTPQWFAEEEGWDCYKEGGK